MGPITLEFAHDPDQQTSHAVVNCDAAAPIVLTSKAGIAVRVGGTSEAVPVTLRVLSVDTGLTLCTHRVVSRRSMAPFPDFQLRDPGAYVLEFSSPDGARLEHAFTLVPSAQRRSRKRAPGESHLLYIRHSY